MNKHLQQIAQRARQALSTWVRLLALIWQTHPWYVTWLLLITLALGLLPALQIQVTTQIIQNASLAVEQGQASSLVRLALLFGALQGGAWRSPRLCWRSHSSNSIPCSRRDWSMSLACSS